MNGAAAAGYFKVSVGGFTVELAFAVESGAALVLFGPSGAGKTTALRTIAGLGAARSPGASTLPAVLCSRMTIAHRPCGFRHTSVASVT